MTKGCCKKVISTSLRDKNSIFVQNPTYLQIQMHDKTVINISELNALVIPLR